MAVVFFDLSVLVPNLKGAFQEGISAAFRTFDITLDEDMSVCALGKTYAEGVRAIYCDELEMPLPEQKELDQLSHMYENVVRRFVQFSSSLFAASRTVEIIEGLRRAGCQIGLVTDLDAITLVSLMGRLGWEPSSMFDTIVTGGGVQTKDEMLALLMRRLGSTVSGRRTFVGALAKDALPAHFLGCDCILIRNGKEVPKTTEIKGVKYDTFHSMKDLADMLMNQSLESTR